MRMKPSRNFLLGLCSMLALGFLYYSSGRISLRGWSNISLYDSQGFLVKLDRSLPLELLYKYGNLSEGACKPGYAAAKMSAIYPKFAKLEPMFLDPNYKRYAKIVDYSPPFGVKSQEKIIDILLSATKNYGLGEELDSMSCKTCIIIGNGGILANKSLGPRIDEIDVVVRLNEAPVKGFEKDVGSKTTMRITYPEGAIQKTERYESQSLFVLSAFKALDLRWLRYMVFNQRLSFHTCRKLLKNSLYFQEQLHSTIHLADAFIQSDVHQRRSTDGFWKSVAKHVPREPSDMRILNPYFIQEASFKLIGLPHNNGQMGKGNIPTLGAVAITMALHTCDEVAVAGFGYNMSTPHAPLHYYEKIRMSAIKESWTHNISKEKEFLMKLVKAGVIQDWTNGVCGAGC
ncbi:ST3 beta-galactoside alpha-2,3-sialyltransferase 3a isoform X1 [Labrus bergylta]|uniref:ST3 beta-galactoside alpha-2,3-sialyltransferase 3 n=1 Tax=Labrus bergylta TaxID=56723 RepID=A0A3Q3FBF0_9LABR